MLCVNFCVSLAVATLLAPHGTSRAARRRTRLTASASDASLAELYELMRLRQSSESRMAVEAALASLLPAGELPPTDPTELNGRWKLLWSSQTADVNPFAQPDSVLGGECIQAIALSPELTGRLDNIVQWAPGWQLIGGAAVAPARTAAARLILSVDSAALQLAGATLDFSLSAFAKLIDRTKRERSEDEGTGADADDLVGRGWLECLLLDGGQLRVSRDNTGFLYVHQRRADRDGHGALEDGET